MAGKKDNAVVAVMMAHHVQNDQRAVEVVVDVMPWAAIDYSLLERCFFVLGMSFSNS